MAYQHHLNLLKKGPRAWNIWREKHANIQLDLSFTRLIGLHLIGANLVDINLSGVDRSEERRVGVEFRYRWWAYDYK